jgi:hypothetical protein
MGQGTAVLVLGHHRLEGKLVPLSKPMAVVRRIDVPPGTAAPPSYAVVAVLADKVVFKNRPQPIIADDTRTGASASSSPAVLRRPRRLSRVRVGLGGAGARHRRGRAQVRHACACALPSVYSLTVQQSSNSMRAVCVCVCVLVLAAAAAAAAGAQVCGAARMGQWLQRRSH